MYVDTKAGSTTDRTVRVVLPLDRLYRCYVLAYKIIYLGFLYTVSEFLSGLSKCVSSIQCDSKRDDEEVGVWVGD